VQYTTEAPPAARRVSSPSGEKRYSVKSVWRTLQGEGAWAGRPAVFVRFTGCNMWTGYEKDRAADAERNSAACPLWCDTDFTKEGAAKLSASDLVDEMLSVAGDIRFCVLTGGEPFLQADGPLIRALHDAGFFVATETNGTLSLAETFGDIPPDWVVCSPKLSAEQLVIEHMDELKLVVPDYLPEDFAALAGRTRVQELGGTETKFLWLQPEDGARLKEATRLAVDLAQANPSWRVSVQIHKVLGVE